MVRILYIVASNFRVWLFTFYLGLFKAYPFKYAKENIVWNIFGNIFLMYPTIAKPISWKHQQTFFFFDNQ